MSSYYVVLLVPSVTYTLTVGRKRDLRVCFLDT